MVYKENDFAKNEGQAEKISEELERESRRYSHGFSEEEDEDDFSDENDINEDMLDEFLFSDSLYFCSSTKKGCGKKDIAKRRKKNKNKKTHRKR